MFQCDTLLRLRGTDQRKVLFGSQVVMRIGIDASNNKPSIHLEAPLHITIPLRKAKCSRDGRIIKIRKSSMELVLFRWTSQCDPSQFLASVRAASGSGGSTSIASRPKYTRKVSRGERLLAVATGKVTLSQIEELDAGAKPIPFLPKTCSVLPRHEHSEADLSKLFHGIIKKRLRQDRTFAYFPKQAMALEHVFEEERRRSADLHVFAEDISRTGARRFLVASYDEFYDRYRLLPQGSRHMYEVIEERRPCHLYFDLEFKTAEYPLLDGPEMVVILIHFLCLYILQEHSFTIHRHDIVELDSSTEEKFSQHLIVRIPGAVWASNIHMGVFVKRFVNHLATLAGRGDSDAQALFFPVELDQRGGEGPSAPATRWASTNTFIDLGVYTRNRNFRIYLSSKYGKTSELQFSSENQTAFQSKKEAFLATLICNVTYSTDIVFLTEEQITSSATYPGTSGKNILSRAPTLTRHSTSESFLSPDQEKALNEHVRTIYLNRGGVPGVIRAVAYLEEQNMVVYHFAGNRFCERIGRHHKSNNVMIVADVRKAISYQKCHDRECRGYRSPEMPLPQLFRKQTQPPPPQPSPASLVWDLDEIGYDALVAAITSEPEKWGEAGGHPRPDESSTFESVDEYILAMGSSGIEVQAIPASGYD